MAAARFPMCCVYGGILAPDAFCFGTDRALWPLGPPGVAQLCGGRNNFCCSRRALDRHLWPSFPSHGKGSAGVAQRHRRCWQEAPPSFAVSAQFCNECAVLPGFALTSSNTSIIFGILSYGYRTINAPRDPVLIIRALISQSPCIIPYSYPYVEPCKATRF